MIAEWPGLVDASENKGWEDGCAAAPYAPLLAEGMNAGADDAYCSAYFHGLAYGSLPRGK